jgi:RNA polymerase sigma factor (TIGR02999 family)
MHQEPSRGADALFEAAYEDLRKLARARLRGTAPLTLLDTTALVNESWLRLSSQGALPLESRRRFFAYASAVMRHVIVDTLRHAASRGGDSQVVTLDTALRDSLPQPQAPHEALQLDEALQSLAQLEPRLAQVVEMRYFGGYTEIEIGQALNLTERTVRRDWEKARVLLASMLA